MQNKQKALAPYNCFDISAHSSAAHCDRSNRRARSELLACCRDPVKTYVFASRQDNEPKLETN